MELHVLLWILTGAFTVTWGFGLFFMNQSNNIHLAIRDDISAIHLEMKDFHGRLCAIEERNKGK